MEYSLIYVSCKNEEEASLIAKKLLELELIACANIFPRIKSLYEWKGSLCQEEESVLILKTQSKKFEIIESEIKELHSYECPCILKLNIDDGNKAFLNWIGSKL